MRHDIDDSIGMAVIYLDGNKEIFSATVDDGLLSQANARLEAADQIGLDMMQSDLVVITLTPKQAGVIASCQPMNPIEQEIRKLAARLQPGVL